MTTINMGCNNDLDNHETRERHEKLLPLFAGGDAVL